MEIFTQVDGYICFVLRGKEYVTPSVIKSSQMAQDCPGFKTESPMSGEPPLLQVNQSGWSPCPVPHCVT